MAQVKFLSQTGLSTVWNRIKEVFATKTSVNNLNKSLTDNIGALNESLTNTTKALLESDAAILQAVDNEAKTRADAVAAEKKAREEQDVNITNIITASVKNLSQIDQQLSSQIGTVQQNANLWAQGARNLAAEGKPVSNWQEYFQTDLAQDNSEGFRLRYISKHPQNIPENEQKYYYYHTGLRADNSGTTPIYYVGNGTDHVIAEDVPIKSLYIQSSVNTISGYSFQNAHLQEIKFDLYGLTTIGQYAFEGNDITSLELPSTLNNIRRCAFINCPNLKYVTFNSTQVPEILQWETEEEKEIFKGCDVLEAIYVPAYLVDAYKEAWPMYADKIQPKSADAGSQDAIDELEEKMYSEIEILKGMINADYVNVSEEGV